MLRFACLILVAMVEGWISSPAYAQDIPPDCMASFAVRSESVTVDISWTLAAGRSAALSCGAAELLREQLFVEGNNVLNESDLVGSPADAKQKAATALNNLESKIKSLPGEDVSGTMFAAGGYVVSKYLLASCILTAESAGGTCWAAAGAFIGATYRFFQKVYTGGNNVIARQELLSEVTKVKSALASVTPGQADQAGARKRWVETQTNLCRAIQRDCL